MTQKVSPTLKKWIAHIEWVDYKGAMSVKSHISALLCETKLYNWFYEVLITTWLAFLE